MRWWAVRPPPIRLPADWTLSFTVFGAVLPGSAPAHRGWRIVMYAVLSLVVVGMLPVALAPAGAGMRPTAVAHAAVAASDLCEVRARPNPALRQLRGPWRPR